MMVYLKLMMVKYSLMMVKWVYGHTHFTIIEKKRNTMIKTTNMYVWHIHNKNFINEYYINYNFFLLLQVDKILDVRLTQPGKLLGKNMINLVVWIWQSQRQINTASLDVRNTKHILGILALPKSQSEFYLFCI